MASQNKESGISWTDQTWNPIIGCSRVSEGCRHCYAETIAGRFGKGKPTVYSGLTQIVNGKSVWTGQIKETKQLLQPLSWRTPKRVFVNSMSDLFHENVTDEMRDKIFDVIEQCLWNNLGHIFQILTKRPECQLRYMLARYAKKREFAAKFDLCPTPEMRESPAAVDARRMCEPLANVWLGVSVEDQKAADERIPLLLQTPAAVRFISAEPLLGRVDLTHVDLRPKMRRFFGKMAGNPNYSEMASDILGSIPDGPLPRGECPATNCLTGEWFDGWDSGTEESKIDWVICGGESGAGARPMHPDWVRWLRDQCVVAGVPFFFKQWGEWGPQRPEHNVLAPEDAGTLKPWTVACSSDRKEVGAVSYIAAPPIISERGIHQFTRMKKVGKKAAGHELDGVAWQQFPEGTCVDAE